MLLSDLKGDRLNPGKSTIKIGRPVYLFNSIPNENKSETSLSKP
ncbi:hypothetical protein ACODHD_01115 [Vagococcus fluvialis]|nr:hypothetical protein [Vagococcus fluvialis]